jgi:ABC-2 type transport system ATP-binding protein
MIELFEVGKRYGSVPALHEVSLDLDVGIVALLGRNGAGKSTLLSILAGLSMQTSGVVRFDGRQMAADRRAMRAAATLLPQDLALDPHVSARALVRHLLVLRGRSAERVEEWFEAFGLADVADRPLRTFSGGMRQRVGLAFAFACDTELLLLDEPTQGLDPWERLRFTHHLALAAATKLVVYSTHVVSDVEAVAQRVVVLDRGSLSYNGSPDGLRSSAPSVWIADVDDEFVALHKDRLTSVTRIDARLFRVRGIGDPRPEMAKPVEANLCDAYLALTHAVFPC